MPKRSAAYLFGQLAGVFFALLAVYFIYLLVTTSDQTRLAILTAAVSVGGLIYTNSKNVRREVEARHFAKKAEAYEEIIQTIFLFMNATRKNKILSHDDVTDKIGEILPKLMIWAGPEVLSAWNDLATQSDDPFAPLVSGNGLIAALRKELGHTKDASLGPLGLISVVLKPEDRESLKP